MISHRFQSSRIQFNFKSLPAPQAQQSQKAIAAAQEHPKLEPGSYYKNVNYVPPDIPPVPSIQHLIQICSKPFEKQLAKNDVTRELRLKDCDVETHILPLLNPSEDPKQGIWITVYDITGSEYKMMFKATRVRNNIQALTSVGWKHFVEHHGLVNCQDFVTLWAFRNAQTGKLCFVICLRYGLQHEKV
ncbi:hypothetical protein ACFX13_027660 [Malus domestica]